MPEDEIYAIVLTFCPNSQYEQKTSVRTFKGTYYQATTYGINWIERQPGGETEYQFFKVYTLAEWVNRTMLSATEIKEFVFPSS